MFAVLTYPLSSLQKVVYDIDLFSSDSLGSYKPSIMSWPGAASCAVRPLRRRWLERLSVMLLSVSEEEELRNIMWRCLYKYQPGKLDGLNGATETQRWHRLSEASDTLTFHPSSVAFDKKGEVERAVTWIWTFTFVLTLLSLTLV